MAKAVLTFALYQGDALSRRETISQDIIKVGKDPKSHLQVEDELASRMHAVIEVGDTEDISLIDLGNEPATQVNGAPVSKCKLAVGDQIVIGNTLIVLERIDPAGAQVQPAGALSSNPFAAVAAPVAAAPVAPAQQVSSNPFASSSNPFAAGSNPFAAPAHPFAPAQQQPPAPPAFGGGFGGGHQVGGGHHGHGHDDFAPGTYTYEMLKSGPAVPPDEVELSHVPAVEVLVSWDTNVLHVSHLSPPRTFYVGEPNPADKKDKTDFFIPEEKLPIRKMPVVVGDAMNIAVVLPQGATGWVQIPGQQRMTVDQIRPHAQPCGEVPGAQQFTLSPGASAKIEVNGFTFQVAAVNAGKPFKKGVGAGFDWTVAMYFGLTFLSFGSLLASMAYFVPPLGLTDESEIDKNRLLLIQQYLNAAAEREQEEKTEDVVAEDADNKEGGTGERHKGEEGSMGKETSKAQNKRYAVKGPADNPDPHLAKQAALREARDFGMIGLLNAGAAGDPNAPTSPFGRETSSGLDEVSAQGNMWGDEIGEAFGAGGLGLTGIGEGGGGRGEGIGLGNIGTMGHGAGTGSGQGFGSGHGRLGGSHATRTPKVRMGATSVNGRLPAEVIQRIVRQNFGRFRMCYEQGLTRNPNLEGRVAVRFVIGRDGAVSNVGNGGSDIPDSGVVSCVVQAFYGLGFPQPEGGIVTVTYPIMFSPG